MPGLIDLGLVIGDTGPIGPTGPTGDTGPTGATGPIGPAGNPSFFGTCATAAATSTKVVSCANYTLQSGTLIAVYFTTAQTATDIALNINNTGAKSLKFKGEVLVNNTTIGWTANSTILFSYDGEYYQIVGIIGGTFISTQLLAASNWSNKVYSLESAYPSSLYDIELSIGSTTTDAMCDALANARIVGSATTNIITALGTQPAIDISVAIFVKPRAA